MDRRSHIIYSHPASSDGYDFFYLHYFPGDHHLALRYSLNGKEHQEVSLAPVAMLDWLERQAASQTEDPVLLRPWDRAAKVLRLRLREWTAQGRG